MVEKLSQISSTWEPIIGLEVHVQLKTRSKMFCRSKNAESNEPNVNICEICTGHPGTLPVINREAVKKAIMVGLALNCEVAQFAKFDRKNYFYPDLPKGYQISQYDHPISGKGKMTIIVSGAAKEIGITRAHLEEDAGKLIHPPGKNYSLVDYNRAGVPLLEIVSEPDIRSSEEAKIFLQELQNLMRYLAVSDADMEKGHLRCDANISLRKVGETKLPAYKVEIKNMNSFKAVANAIEYEIKRQTEILDKGKTPLQETRGWIDDKMATVSQRSKEESQDYRYFPEPDLPILKFEKAWIEEIRRELPELPTVRKERFMKEYGLTEKDAQTFVSYKDLSEYLEQVVSELDNWISEEELKLSDEERSKYIKLTGNWLLGPFLAAINAAGLLPGQSKVTAENFAELIKLIGQGKVSQLSAKDVFVKMFETGEDPSNLLDQMGLSQISDEALILEAVKRVIAAYPKAVEDAKIKGEKSFGFLVGQTMKELKGKGNPKIINELIKRELG